LPARVHRQSIRISGASFARTFRGGNSALWWVVGGAVAALATVVSWPPLQRLFGFAPVPAHELAVSFAVGVTAVILFSVAQLLRSSLAIARKGA
jgi:hypothetical protein